MKLRQLLEELTLELNMPKPEDAYKFDSVDKTDLGYGMYYKYVYSNINPHIKLYYQTDKGLNNLETLVKKYGLGITVLSSEKDNTKKITEYHLKINGSKKDIDNLLKNHGDVFDKFNPKGSIEIELGDKMEITTSVQPPTVSPITGKKTSPGKTMFVAFGKYDKDEPEPEDQDEEERKYKTMTGAGDLIKVMATVVEAIRQTAEKEGGMNNIYKMAWSPADKRRKNIYDLYVKTLFPSFEKDLSASSTSFQQYINKDFKGKEVNEIGLDKEKMEPYGFTTEEDGEDRRVYSFETDSGLDYMVELEEEMDDDLGIVLYINFGVFDKDNIAAGSNQNVVTNKGEQYRVMNTLSAIVKEDLAINSYIKYITFNPAKRKLPNPISGKERDLDSNSRAKLYMKYIIGRLSNAKEIEHPNYPILINIK
jgi:hypothetical protein